jgi:hypothetical protein
MENKLEMTCSAVRRDRYSHIVVVAAFRWASAGSCSTFFLLYSDKVIEIDGNWIRLHEIETGERTWITANIGLTVILKFNIFDIFYD